MQPFSIYKVLLVDDDINAIEPIVTLLNNEGFHVDIAKRGKEAIQLAKKEQHHVIILDVVMPEMDGIETCIELRAIEALKKSVIIFYTARNEDYSQIAGFAAGADDYILKPVRPKVFLARITALLKRYNQPINEAIKMAPSVNYKDTIIIDRERYLVLKDGKEVILPRKEFELFSLLFSTPRKVFSRNEISNLVWGYEMVARNRTIDVHVRKLREKIGDRYIRTIKGIGYSFEF